ncbi:amidohydrolase [Microbacterium sediminicola]|uniref:Amidohydrolase n=1 Tax=Microbacterium sediminicola TaxID=415210 RepID=A0ABN2II63_9MICO
MDELQDDHTIVIHGGTVLTMDPRRPVAESANVVIRSGRIAAIDPRSPEELSAAADGPCEVIDAHGHAVLPGLVNAHMHSGLLRGTTEGHSLEDWIRLFIDPAHRELTPADARAAARACYAESLLAGTTSVVDLGRFGAESRDAAIETGIRLNFAPYAGSDGEGLETVSSSRAFLEAAAADPHPRIHPWVGLEHVSYADRATTDALLDLMYEFDVRFHTHTSESAEEVRSSLSRYGRTPVEELTHRGLLHERTLLAHAVHLTDSDRAAIAAAGAAVTHCPTSNLKLGSGVADVPRLHDAGITVALGSDGEKENNSLNMLAEMKLSALLRAGITGTPESTDALRTLRMGTSDGAKALGYSDIGTLTAGYRADIVCIDLHSPGMTPLFTSGPYMNVVEHIVYSASRRDVRTVLVNGEVMVRDGRLTRADIAEIQAEGTERAHHLLQRSRGHVPV